MRDNTYYIELIDRLEKERELSLTEWEELLGGASPEIREYAAHRAGKVREEHFGKKIFVRGLIEFSNYCKNDCYYCGIRKSNEKAHRYRLTKEQILECCREGWKLGFRTFVLQSGEDAWYTVERMTEIIRSIKQEFPECAITLSVGEKSPETYRRYKEAGVDRYLLRHETASEAHYSLLHPENLSGAHRKECLKVLKDLGFQIGAGMMVGAPYQTVKELAEDMVYLKKLNPHMVGIGPFIPHHATPFAREKAGTLEQTVFLLSLTRLMLPDVLLPATTALGTIDPYGREKGMHAGANVVMPNLSPSEVRGDYLLYDNKISTGSEAAQNLSELKLRMENIGFEIVESRGDSPRMGNA